MDELFEKMQKLIVEKLDIDAAKVTLDAIFLPAECGEVEVQ